MPERLVLEIGVSWDSTYPREPPRDVQSEA